jgi:hypothetical protein
MQVKVKTNAPRARMLLDSLLTTGRRCRRAGHWAVLHVAADSSCPFLRSFVPLKSQAYDIEE